MTEQQLKKYQDEFFETSRKVAEVVFRRLDWVEQDREMKKIANDFLIKLEREIKKEK